MGINYDEVLQAAIAENERLGKRPKLLLHVCCAPCSSYVLEAIAAHFDVTLYFYNPNISPAEEFKKRLDELKRFVGEAGHAVSFSVPAYDPSEFFSRVKGLEDLPERRERCRVCYELRLRKTALAAKDGGYDLFTTTLSISPHKNAEWLNEIGLSLEKEIGVPYLCSDFKKRGGYKRSIALSREYGLYRQNYCGCIFSKAEAERREREKADTERCE